MRSAMALIRNSLLAARHFRSSADYRVTALAMGTAY